MKPIEIFALGSEQITALKQLYRSTHYMQLRARAQMILLAPEQHLTAAVVTEMVRVSEETVRRWLKRYLAEGSMG